jgi:hypothetical protein
MFSWFTDNWKTIVTVAASIAVGALVTGLIIFTAPVSLPALLVTTVAIGLGGFASGVTGYYVSHWLNDRPVSAKEALFEGLVGAAFSLLTFGLGRGLAPVVSRVVAPIFAEVLPSEATPLVTRLVSNGVSFGAAGATTGAARQVANNVVENRPLGEHVVSTAERSAVLGTVFSTASEALPLARSTPPSEPPPIDPVTRTVMDRYGLTRDSYVYRVTEPEWVEDGTITGNPNSIATVENPYELTDHPLQQFEPDLELPKVATRTRASTLGPSLNVAVKDPSIYARPGMVRVGIKVGDLVDRGLKIYPDDGALAEGLQPLVVTFNGSVPVTVEPILSFPARTPGLFGTVDTVSR